jgi:hypothetical protein
MQKLRMVLVVLSVAASTSAVAQGGGTSEEQAACARDAQRFCGLDRALDRYGLAGRKVLVSAVGEIPQCSSKLVETAFVVFSSPPRLISCEGVNLALQCAVSDCSSCLGRGQSCRL